MMAASTMAHDHARPDRREARRQFAVRAVFFIFLLSLIEGPLRKWFLPGLGTPLIFQRDPFVIALYVYCLAHGLVWRRGLLPQLWLAMMVITSLVAGVQFMVSGYNPAGWPLGVRTYWLYVPLAFVIARVFRPDDVYRFFRLVLIIAIPYAMLVATQYNAGAGAWVNLGVGGDDEGAVGLSDGILRPFGLFTYTGPNVGFTAATVAMFIAFVLMPERRGAALPLTVAAGLAVGAMAVLTGSRAIYFLVAMIVGLTMVGSILARPTQRTIRLNLAILGFVVAAAVAFVTVFPDMLAAMDRRFETAAGFEGSIWNRAFGGLFSFIDGYSTATVLGHGMGAGAPGIAGYLGLPPLLFGESDTQRNVNELGIVLGTLFLLLRFGTALWLVLLALRCAKAGRLEALPLVGLIALTIATGQITHSPLNGFLPWLVAGFVLAFSRTDRQLIS